MRRKLLLPALVTTALISIEASSYLLIYASSPFLVEPIRATRDIYAEQSDRIRTMLAESGSRRTLFDARLGWRYRPGHRNGDDAVNSQGVRSFRSYTATTPSGVYRISAFGDSFVYGAELGIHDSWPAVLEGDGREFEVLNYGVGGYGTDQALLRYRAEGAEFGPELVMIGFTPTSMQRNVNVYVRFLGTRNSVATKPRFVLNEDGELTLLENPVHHLSEWEGFLDAPELVRRFGSHDHWYRKSIYENPIYDSVAMVRLLTVLWVRLDDRYLRSNRLVRNGAFNEEADAFELTVAILTRFAEEVRRNGAEAAVLILPDRESVTRDRAGSKRTSDSLVAAVSDAKIEVLDATLAFHEDNETSIDSWFNSTDHYSPDGNRRVASWLLMQLRARRDRNPDQGR